MSRSRKCSHEETWDALQETDYQLLDEVENPNQKFAQDQNGFEAGHDNGDDHCRSQVGDYDDNREEAATGIAKETAKDDKEDGQLLRELHLRNPWWNLAMAQKADVGKALKIRFPRATSSK